MTPNLPIAEAFEELAAATVLERGPVPIKAGKGRTRAILVERDGVVVGVTTPGKVLEAVALAIEVEIATQERRPTQIICGQCKALVDIKPKGKIPTHCQKCSPVCSTRRRRAKDVDHARALARASMKKARERDPEKWKRLSRESARKSLAKKKAQEGSK
jgi:hypothetical protein